MTRIHSSVTLLTSRGALVGSRASTLFSSDVSKQPTASDLRVTKSVHVDAKVIGLYLTGRLTEFDQSQRWMRKKLKCLS
jgi:hypothetical protein